MEQVLNNKKEIIYISPDSLKFTNPTNDGKHDLSFLSPDLFKLLTTGDVLSCGYSILLQLKQLETRYPLQKKLKKLRLALEKCCEIDLEDSSAKLKKFLSNPKDNLNVYTLYDEVIGIENYEELHFLENQKIPKFVKIMLAFRFPKVATDKKFKFNNEEESECRELFEVLEQKYFDNTIDYQVPIFDTEEREFFKDYQSNDSELKTKVQNVGNYGILIESTHIRERFTNNILVAELIRKFGNTVIFTGMMLLTFIVNSALKCRFDEYLKYFGMDSLDIVHTGPFEEREELINTIVNSKKNKYSCQKNYRSWRTIDVTGYIGDRKQYNNEDLIKNFKNMYKLDENTKVNLTQKLDSKTDQIRYEITSDKIRLEFAAPNPCIYQIYSYPEIEDYYKNHSAIRISMKKYEIYAYPSAMNLLANRNFNSQSISDDVKYKGKKHGLILDLINKGFTYNSVTKEEKEKVENDFKNSNEYAELM